MNDIKGPAIDPTAFRVEGHCCGIRIPALTDLDGENAAFEISSEIKAEALSPLGLPKRGAPRASAVFGKP